MPPHNYRFNRALLDELITRDGATLVGEYDTLTSQSRITYKCNCGEEYTRMFLTMEYNNGAYCRSCIKKKGQEKRKVTCIERYGVESPCQLKEVKEKQKATLIKKYGVDSPLKSKEIREKVKQTNLIKYGSTCVLASPEMRDKITHIIMEKYGTDNPFKSDVVKQQIKETNLAKYGDVCARRTPAVKKKAEATSLAKYGTKRPSESDAVKSKITRAHREKTKEERDAIKEKIKKTCRKKYGVDSSNQSEIVKKNKIAASLEKYGVEYPNQSTEVLQAVQNRGYKHKLYKMPSGDIRKVQGYEPLALDELLKVYTEDQIITTRKDIPRIPYVKDEKTHYYHPDIYIPHINKIIEVKSTWTYKCMTDKIKEKADATKAAGYDYEIWVYNGKKERVYPEIAC